MDFFLRMQASVTKVEIWSNNQQQSLHMTITITPKMTMNAYIMIMPCIIPIPNRNIEETCRLFSTPLLNWGVSFAKAIFCSLRRYTPVLH